MKTKYILLSAIASVLLLSNCNNNNKSLPILGNPVYKKSETGKIDTIYPTISDFKFIDQDSNIVTNESFKNKIYVADFIFLSCPGICPKMNENMFSVYKSFQNNPDILFLSHTIDTENDSIPRLKAYTDNLNVSSKKWHFVTGNQDSIYSIAENCYFSTAYKDNTAPEGYIHSGGLLLIDKKKHIRGVYDGTDTIETKRLINDIHILLKEQF